MEETSHRYVSGGNDVRRSLPLDLQADARRARCQLSTRLERDRDARPEKAGFVARRRAIIGFLVTSRTRIHGPNGNKKTDAEEARVYDLLTPTWAGRRGLPVDREFSAGQRTTGEKFRRREGEKF
jgi:hypothetical protein